MTVAVSADVYPALLEIQLADGTRKAVDRVRVLVVGLVPDQRVIAFADGANGPEIIYSQSITNYVPPLKAQRLRELGQPQFRLHTADLENGSLTLTKGTGCGCGSRLKSFNPFPSITSIDAS